ncbi:hypothetical protein ABK040_006115 [Willaertia magna]
MNNISSTINTIESPPFTVTLYTDQNSQPCRAVEILCQLLNINYDRKEVNALQAETREESFKKLNPFCSLPTLTISLNQDNMNNQDQNLVPSFTLFESHAIMRFLCRLASPKEIGETGENNTFQNVYPMAHLLNYKNMSTEIENMSSETKVMNEFFWAPLKLTSKVDQYLEWHHLNIRAYTSPIIHGFLFLEFGTNLPKSLKNEIIETKIKPFHTQLQDGLGLIENYFLKKEKEQKPQLLATEASQSERSAGSPLAEKTFLCSSEFLTIADLSAGCELYHLYCYGYPFVELGYKKIVHWLHHLEEIKPFKDVHKSLISRGNEFKKKYYEELQMLL